MVHFQNLLLITRPYFCSHFFNYLISRNESFLLKIILTSIVETCLLTYIYVETSNSRSNHVTTTALNDFTFSVAPSNKEEPTRGELQQD